MSYATDDDHPHLTWINTLFSAGNTVRLSLPLVTFSNIAIDPALLYAYTFLLEHEARGAPSATASLAAGTVGLMTPEDADPELDVLGLPHGIPMYEIVIDTAQANLPAGWYKGRADIIWPYGPLTISRGRLLLR